MDSDIAHLRFVGPEGHTLGREIDEAAMRAAYEFGDLRRRGYLLAVIDVETDCSATFHLTRKGRAAAGFTDRPKQGGKA